LTAPISGDSAPAITAACPREPLARTEVALAPPVPIRARPRPSLVLPELDRAHFCAPMTVCEARVVGCAEEGHTEGPPGRGVEAAKDVWADVGVGD
jgi:hypothetical protein